MANRIIHKRNTSTYTLGGEALCGRWYPHYSLSSYQWKKVTCKNCLKARRSKQEARKSKHAIPPNPKGIGYPC